jgi:hypothetical protein
MSANYAAGVVVVVVVLAVLYHKTSLASGRNGILIPPGPPAHWFWSNALPSVK